MVSLKCWRSVKVTVFPGESWAEACGSGRAHVKRRLWHLESGGSPAGFERVFLLPQKPSICSTSPPQYSSPLFFSFCLGTKVERVLGLSQVAGFLCPLRSGSGRGNVVIWGRLCCPEWGADLRLYFSSLMNSCQKAPSFHKQWEIIELSFLSLPLWRVWTPRFPRTLLIPTTYEAKWNKD